MRYCTGHVCDPSGRPIVGAAIRLLVAGTSGPTALQRHWSDEFGWFELHTHARGLLELEVSASGYTTRRLVVDGSEDWLVLTPLAAIDGKVLGPRGWPLASVEVLAVDLDDPECKCSTWSRWDGSFRLRVPRGRRFRIEGSTNAGKRIAAVSSIAGGGPQIELRIVP